ncbi:uncharacterized protein LOC135469621 isoform X2 [Liolophura sinensis]
MAIKHIKQLQAKLDTCEIKQQQADPASAYLLQKPCCSEKFYMGFKECEAELMRFLVEKEGWDAKDQICSRLMKQLDEASKKYTGNFGAPEGFNSDGKKDTDSQQLIYSGTDCMSMEPYTSPAPSSVYDGDMQDMMQYRGGTFSGYSMNNDKHLRTLLEKNTTPSSTENESGIASLTNREPDTPGKSMNLDENMDSDKKSSSSPHDSLDQREDCHTACLSSRRVDDGSSYKFKQNITLRFSEEKRKASDTSSSSSREGGSKAKVRRKVPKTIKSLSPQSDSSIYPTSEYSCNGNATSSTGDNPSQGNMPEEHKNIKEEFRLNGVSLPGFILHPMGLYYLPISLTESQVSMLGLVPFIEASVQQHAALLHPINIPVNFGSNSLTMRSINIHTSFAQNRNSYCEGDQRDCSKV